MTTALRALTAVAVLANGAVHLQRYLQGFDALPVIGPLFLANVVAAVVIAVALVAWRDSVVPPAAALVFSAGTIAALVVAKTVGLFAISAAAPLDTAEVWAFATETIGLILAVALLAVVAGRGTDRAPRATDERSTAATAARPGVAEA